MTSRFLHKPPTYLWMFLIFLILRSNELMKTHLNHIIKRGFEYLRMEHVIINMIKGELTVKLDIYLCLVISC